MINERDLDLYLDGWMKRHYPRYLGNRFFQGIIRSVSTSSSPILCTLSQLGETGSDGNTYVAMFRPAVGQVCICVWLDEGAGLVLWPVGGLGWIDYTPTVTPGGSMTIAAVAADNRFHSRYCQIGKMVFVHYGVVWTFGAPFSDNVAVTLPPPPAKYQIGTFMGQVQNVAARVGQDSSQAVFIYRYDGALFTGQSWVQFEGFYETA